MTDTQDQLPSWEGPSRLNTLCQILKARSSEPTPPRKPQQKPENSTLRQKAYQPPHTSNDFCERDGTAQVEETGYEWEIQGPWEIESVSDRGIEQLQDGPKDKAASHMIRNLEERVITLEHFIEEQDKWNNNAKETMDDVNKMLQGPDVPTTTGRRTTRTKRSG